MNTLNAAGRREAIAATLSAQEGPVSATALAEQFHVSRQIVVGDIALLRASGADISATPRGYVLARPGTVQGVLRTLACVHSPADMGRELMTIVDNGGEAVDVIVEHQVYGQLVGSLQVRTWADVGEFLSRVEAEGARPLSDLTGGIHLHTVRCPNEETLRRVTEALDREGFLLHMYV